MSSHAGTRQNRLTFRKPETRRINQIAVGITGHHPAKRFRLPLALPKNHRLTGRGRPRETTRNAPASQRGRGPSGAGEAVALRNCPNPTPDAAPEFDRSTQRRAESVDKRWATTRGSFRDRRFTGVTCNLAVDVGITGPKPTCGD
jgi:hypothetical protein